MAAGDEIFSAVRALIDAVIGSGASVASCIVVMTVDFDAVFIEAVLFVILSVPILDISAYDLVFIEKVIASIYIVGIVMLDVLIVVV
ncbi:MAG: hypothetical protein IJV08_11445 [Bacteroidaceae bacterium]|nr:hypothetical protein [Bacteroidaceae bacterium]